MAKCPHCGSDPTELLLAQTENAGHIRIEDELKAELREMEKDAARYRWLRNYTTVHRYGTDEHGIRLPHIEHVSGNLMRGSVAQHLDAAIDAAISAKTPSR